MKTEQFHLAILLMKNKLKKTLNQAEQTPINGLQTRENVL